MQNIIASLPSLRLDSHASGHTMYPPHHVASRCSAVQAQDTEPDLSQQDQLNCTVSGATPIEAHSGVVCKCMSGFSIR